MFTQKAIKMHRPIGSDPVFPKKKFDFDKSHTVGKVFLS